jgi:hypothetical protein
MELPPPQQQPEKRKQFTEKSEDLDRKHRPDKSETLVRKIRRTCWKSENRLLGISVELPPQQLEKLKSYQTNQKHRSEKSGKSARKLGRLNYSHGSIPTG